ncbi:Uncharacterized protein PBTT_06681 [Plasmodiophora brassicae]
MGGAYAAMPAKHYNLPCTLGHTFTTADAMIAKVPASVVPSNPEGPTLRGFASGVSSSAFRVGLYDRLPAEAGFLEPNTPFLSDGMRTIDKTGASRVSVFVLFGAEEFFTVHRRVSDAYDVYM